MRYEAVLSKNFLKQFKKLPGNVRARVELRVEELSLNPHLGLQLRGSLEGFWRDRVGVYRIIYQIDSSAGKIIFHDVDLRKKVYD